jgi:NADH:ubiquinone oxidoreductase subunit 6 (subunit J)
MGGILVLISIDVAVMIAFPFVAVAITRRQPPEPYSWSPKVERRLLILKLFVGECCFSLMVYPLALNVMLGVSGMPDNPDILAWALPVGYIWAVVVFVAVLVLGIIDLYKSHRYRKTRLTEQHVPPNSE